MDDINMPPKFHHLKHNTCWCCLCKTTSTSGYLMEQWLEGMHVICNMAFKSRSNIKSKIYDGQNFYDYVTEILKFVYKWKEQ